MAHRIWLGTMLTLALATALAGCASGGKVRFSAARLCTGAGGTYNRADHTCDAPPVNKKKASEMCASRGGVYFAAEDECELEGDK